VTTPRDPVICPWVASKPLFSLVYFMQNPSSTSILLLFYLFGYFSGYHYKFLCGKNPRGLSYPQVIHRLHQSSARVPCCGARMWTSVWTRVGAPVDNLCTTCVQLVCTIMVHLHTWPTTFVHYNGASYWHDSCTVTHYVTLWHTYVTFYVTMQGPCQSTLLSPWNSIDVSHWFHWQFYAVPLVYR
jgi:hypothetical protein